MATQKLVFQTNDEVKQNWNWGCSLPCPDAGYKYHRPGATKAVDAKAGFSCGFQWSGGVGVRSIFGFGYDREASGFVGCLGLFLAVLSLCCCTWLPVAEHGLEGAWASVIAAPGFWSSGSVAVGPGLSCSAASSQTLRTRD